MIGGFSPLLFSSISMGENIMITGMTGGRGEFSPHDGLDVEKERQRQKLEEETTKGLPAMTCFLEQGPKS